MSDLSKVRLMINSLTVYRSILTDETVSRFLRLLAAAEGGDAASLCVEYGAFFYSLAEADPEVNFSAHLEKLVRYDDNAFSRAAARGETGESYRLLRKAAEYDLTILSKLALTTSEEIKKLSNGLENEANRIELMPEFVTNIKQPFFDFVFHEPIREVEDFYRSNGYGVFAKVRAFRWQAGKGLVGVSNPDPVCLGSLKEYEYERGLVAANTLDFAEGRGGGNLLLYGDRGTGKSSTVKALANEYREKGLRIVELSKEAIFDFYEIMDQLHNVPQRFILFLDDLTFSEDDATFSALKSILEGGVAARPENCLVYATSNRRHLVRESFADRNPDDVHAGDTMQEKLALYDRFDQTINFFAPDQAKYLAIIRALAKERQLNAPIETLERGAVQWAIRAGGRSPRTAKQFIDWAIVQLQKGSAILE